MKGWKNSSKKKASNTVVQVTLLDLQNLFDLWVEHYENLSQDARQRLPLKPIYFLAPEE